jgi:hypothetical protein
VPKRGSNSCTANLVRLTLQRSSCGLLLDLDERRIDGPRVRVVTAFTGAASFNDWCNDDPLRFEAPIVQRQAQRDADALWQLEP